MVKLLLNINAFLLNDKPTTYIKQESCEMDNGCIISELAGYFLCQVLTNGLTLIKYQTSGYCDQLCNCVILLHLCFIRTSFVSELSDSSSLLKVTHYACIIKWTLSIGVLSDWIHWKHFMESWVCHCCLLTKSTNLCMAVWVHPERMYWIKVLLEVHTGIKCMCTADIECSCQLKF